MTKIKRSRLIARVQGGLGNQLFIFASALACSIKLSIPLSVDTRSGFWNDRYKRSYQLYHFGIQAPYCSLIISLIIKAVDRLKIKLPFFYFIKEKNYGLTHLSKKSILVLNDNFQDEIYFKDIKSKLLELFHIHFNTEHITKLKNNYTTIALHGRLLRAYASDGSLVSTNDPKVLPYDYYNKAIKQISNKFKNPYFIIFSDSPNDFIENIELCGHPYYLSTNTTTEADFAAMRQCSHFIISNSSYSWWAAWLSETKDTLIISPPPIYWDNPKTVPERWTVV